jgi:putative membrane protein
MFGVSAHALLFALQGESADGLFVRHLLAALGFAVVGLVFFAIAFLVMVKSMPFSVRKEIEEDQNVALAIVMASVIVGIAIIVGMAVKG